MSFDIGKFEELMPDPEVIRSAGSTLKTKADSFESKASSSSSSWAKLQGAGVYSAPGDEVVFSAFTPITTAASDLVSDVSTVTKATDGFAADVEVLQTKLAGVKADAAAFEKEVDGRSRDEWDDDENLVKKEQGIIDGLNGLYSELQAAQMTCANAITAIYGGPQYVMVTQDGPKAGEVAYGYTKEQLNAASAEGSIPWGKPTEWDKPWYRDAWDGVCSFGKGVWSGVTGTVKGLWNMVNVGDMDTFKATWTGLGKLAMNVAIVSSPIAQVALRATGHGDVADRAGTELLAVGKAAIHWDDWKRDPAYAAGATSFDLATILLSAGGGAVAKAGSVAGKVAEVSNAGGKAASVVNATMIASLAKITVKGVDLTQALKLKGITIATDGIKVAGAKIGHLPTRVSGGASNLSTRVAAMADELGMGGPRVATAGAHGGGGVTSTSASAPGRGLTDAAGAGAGRPSVMHLDADGPSRGTGTGSTGSTGSNGSQPSTGPASGAGGRVVPEGEPRFGVRTEDGTPTGKPVIHPETPEGSTKPAGTTAAHSDAPKGTAKPAASTTAHPGAPEGSAKPADSTTAHPEAPEGSAKPAGTTAAHSEAPEGSTKPAASTTAHPEAPEGSTKPAVDTRPDAPEGLTKPATGTHPDAPQGSTQPAATSHPDAPESRSAAPSTDTDTGRIPGGDAPARTHETQLDLGAGDRPVHDAPDGQGSGPSDTAEHTTPHDGAEPARPAGPEGYPRPEAQHTVQVAEHELPKVTHPFGRDGGLQPSTAYEVPGRGTYYTNAEGRIHYVETEYGTKGHLNPDLMDPAPDTTYVVGDNHVFQTDGSARTVLAHVEDLFRGDAYRSSSVTGRIGREGGIGYEGGHLLAKMFGGGTEDINIVPMLREVNRGAGHSFGNMERGLEKLLKLEGGPSINLKVVPRFSTGSSVPTRITMYYRLNGEDWIKGGFQNFK